jgi:hypothetical protein
MEGGIALRAPKGEAIKASPIALRAYASTVVEASLKRREATAKA